MRDSKNQYFMLKKNPIGSAGVACKPAGIITIPTDILHSNEVINIGTNNITDFAKALFTENICGIVVTVHFTLHT